MSNTGKNKSKVIILHAVTPLIVAALSLGIMLTASIKPKDKMKVYLNLLFMDDLKTDPDEESKGLIIRENEIVEEYTGNTSDTGEFIRPRYGEMYAVITSEKLELDVPVYWGSDIDLFERGACQSTGSVIAGDKGNTVISAHEDTYFAKLSELEEGDTVTLKTNYGVFTYTVRERISFKKTSSKYVVPSEDDRLTLYTCKKDVLGSPDDRIGVICDLTEKKFYNAGEDEK